MENLDKLVLELCKYSNELQWLEFKCNNYEPDMIAKDISALANGAALEERPCAYFIWGVDDKTHKLIGTTHDLHNLKKGAQELENWLRSLLSKNADFEYQLVDVNGIKIGVMIIQAAAAQPVDFEKIPYIRVGSYTKKLQEYPALQSRLWSKIHNKNFETQYAKQDLSLTEALQLLDYGVYFDLTGIPQPTTPENIAHYLSEEEIIIKQDNGLYAVTNMGALLLGKRLSAFPRVSRKAIRVVQYEGINRLKMLKEDVGVKGYVVGFEGLMKFVEALLPSQEVIHGAARETQNAYPLLAVREAIANALIHQDFSVSGTGPTVEIFDGRIEVINSGTPLVDINRIIDNPPRSRNERLAALMRRLRMCEELGTGWDKIVLTCETAQLPAPKIGLYEDSTKVTLFAKVPFTNLSSEEKLWAVYLHACIQYVQGQLMTNSSLRERFGLPDTSSSSISRLLKDATSQNLIKPFDPDTSNKYKKYVPIWA